MRIHPRPSAEPTVFHHIQTVSPQMREFFERLQRAARSDASILIRGETGTGKELCARAIHTMSDRPGRFEALNCATLTPDHLASELFGHVKGAFTGAVRDRPGLLRLADGGTLFLDEIAEMPLDLQARMLRVLQERRFTPLGGTDSVRIDVRVLSATHQALRTAVAERRFREDLMFRIRVIPLFLPPLAEREGDVEALAWVFLDGLNARTSVGREITGIATDARDALLAYEWPGNVRELRNAIEHAHAMGEGPVLTLDSLPPELLGQKPRANRRGSDERSRLERALLATGGKKAEAAALLQMSRSTLWRKMREHGL